MNINRTRNYAACPISLARQSNGTHSMGWGLNERQRLESGNIVGRTSEWSTARLRGVRACVRARVTR